MLFYNKICQVIRILNYKSFNYIFFYFTYLLSTEINKYANIQIIYIVGHHHALSSFFLSHLLNSLSLIFKDLSYKVSFIYKQINKMYYI